MTERRDPPPFSSPPRSPGEPLRRSVPFARLASPHLSRRRLSAGIAAAILLAVSGWIVLKLIEKARSWVHERPEYAVPFDRITLDPPPPEFLRSGRETLLGRVEEKSRLPDPIPLLDQDLEALGLAFAKYSPWVAKVERVDRTHPDRITVRLVYRKPVARINLSGGDFLAVADDAVVLPGEDLRTIDANRLVRIEEVPPAQLTRPGHYLGANDSGKIPEEVLSAVRLARIFGDHDPGTSPRVVAINLHYGPGKLLVKTRRGLWVRWGNSPGDEGEGEPKASEKLDRLIRWEDARGDRAVIKDDYLRFTPEGAVLQSEADVPKSSREERSKSRPINPGG